jgi:hypothetical protein
LGYVILSEAKNLSSAQPRFFTPLRSVQNDGIEFNIVEILTCWKPLEVLLTRSSDAHVPHSSTALFPG